MQSKSLITILTLFCFLTKSVSAQIDSTKAACKGDQECCEKPSGIKAANHKTSTPINTMKKDKVVACKLTSPELQKRKAEVIALLKANVLERKELANGYQYSFKGSDKILDDLVSFIKTERTCCNFLAFTLSVEDEETNLVLTLTGPKGTKEFIHGEIEL